MNHLANPLFLKNKWEIDVGRNINKEKNLQRVSFFIKKCVLNNT